MSDPTREGSSLDLFLENRGGLVGDVSAGGCLGHSHHRMMMSFQVSDKERESAEQPAWTFRGQVFGLFRYVVTRVPWVTKEQRGTGRMDTHHEILKT